jgi:hypothetical protein
MVGAVNQKHGDSSKNVQRYISAQCSEGSGT